MGMKKKLGLGIASATLGLTLVGGGTWAAFNDVETLGASYAAGKLDLKADDTTLTGVNLSNLKPGDVFQKEFTLDNIGTLAIKDVLLKVGFSEFVDYVGGEDTDIWGTNTAEEFLSQFTITVASIGTEGGNGYTKDIIKDVNLNDFVNMTSNKAGKPATGTIEDTYYDAESGRVNVVTKTGADGSYHGLPVNPDDQDKVLFTIKFDNHDEKDEKGVQLQNKYQGDSIKLDFNFEARQWDGLTISEEHVNEDGYIAENEKSHSEDESVTDPGEGGEEQPPGDGDGEEQPGDGDGEEQPVTLENFEVSAEWSTYWDFIFQKDQVTATGTFTFSDGTVLTDVQTKKNAKTSGQKLTFSVEHEGEKYTKTETVRK